MCKFLKQLFCKHEWEIFNAETPIEAQIIDTNKGKNLQYKTRIGIQVQCVKCDKIHKSATKVLKQIKIRDVKRKIFLAGMNIVKEHIYNVQPEYKEQTNE